jgi:hypothetical protein
MNRWWTVMTVGVTLIQFITAVATCLKSTGFVALYFYSKLQYYVCAAMAACIHETLRAIVDCTVPLSPGLPACRPWRRRRRSVTSIEV